jgi:integrase
VVLQKSYIVSIATAVGRTVIKATVNHAAGNVIARDTRPIGLPFVRELANGKRLIRRNALKEPPGIERGSEEKLCSGSGGAGEKPRRLNRYKQVFLISCSRHDQILCCRWNKNKEGARGFNSLTDYTLSIDNTSTELNRGGFVMKNIQPIGVCHVKGCKERFQIIRGIWLCPVHHVEPKYFLIEFNWKGIRVRRGTDLNGDTLRTLADAMSLRDQAFREIKSKKFDPSKWLSKLRVEYLFKTQVMTWYKEKVKLLDKGQRAYSYIPKIKGYIENYYMDYFAEMDVREVLPYHVKDWYLTLPERSPKTIKNVVTALSSFFKQLWENRVIEQPLKFPSVEVDEHEPECLSPEVQMMILESIPAKHMPIFTFLFFQGCRPSEARALKWDCINGDIVTYRRTYSANRLQEHTKTKHIRHNLIFPETQAMLPSRTFPRDFVFTHGSTVKRSYGFSMLNSIYRTAIKSFNEKHGLNLSSNLYEHTKHSFGTQLVNKGIDRSILKDWFGHTTMATTEKYAKFRVVDAMRKIQSLESISHKLPTKAKK